jgi:regulator of protease activity HflC (stomatin/prohibitin superfamily)
MAAVVMKRRETGEPRPVGGEAPMMNPISFLVFLVLEAAAIALAVSLRGSGEAVVAVVLVVGTLLAFLAAAAIRLAAQWERGVVFRLGKYRDTKGPGLFTVIPFIDQVRKVDTRVLAVNVPKQQVITRDNVPVTIDGVLFFRVRNAAEAIISVQDYRYVISNYAQTSLRDVIGQMSLDQLLTEREQIAKMIEQHVENDTKGWGLEVTGLRIQDIDMPEELKKMMSRQASAEREKRANITKAEGDRDAAINLAQAARTMRESPGAMQLRTLQTIDGLGPTSSNTVVLAVPVELMELIGGTLGKWTPSASAVGGPNGA